MCLILRAAGSISLVVRVCDNGYLCYWDLIKYSGSPLIPDNYALVLPGMSDWQIRMGNERAVLTTIIRTPPSFRTTGTWLCQSSLNQRVHVVAGGFVYIRKEHKRPPCKIIWLVFFITVTYKIKKEYSGKSHELSCVLFGLGAYPFDPHLLDYITMTS